MTIELEYLLINSNKEENEANWEYLNLNNTIEAETETTIERGLVTDIMTPLDTASIALQDGRSNVQSRLSKQITASASLLLNKGKRPKA